jgi:hypothetical protein
MSTGKTSYEIDYHHLHNDSNRKSWESRPTDAMEIS